MFKIINRNAVASTYVVSDSGIQNLTILVYRLAASRPVATVYIYRLPADMVSKISSHVLTF